jgi:hypothetical protein
MCHPCLRASLRSRLSSNPGSVGGPSPGLGLELLHRAGQLFHSSHPGMGSWRLHLGRLQPHSSRPMPPNHLDPLPTHPTQRALPSSCSRLHTA